MILVSVTASVKKIIKQTLWLVNVINCFFSGISAAFFVLYEIHKRKYGKERAQAGVDKTKLRILLHEIENAAQRKDNRTEQINDGCRPELVRLLIMVNNTTH